MKKTTKDPHAAREAEKYANPVPSREYIMQYLRERGKPALRADIIRELEVVTAEEQEGLRRRLRAMERDGQLMFTRRGGYGLIDKMDLVRGTVVGHKDGYGFIIPDTGGGDLFLTAFQMRAAFDGDRVLARVKPQQRRGKREADIVEVLQRRHEALVGRYLCEDGISFVTPENKRINQNILIPVGQEQAAKPGQFVMVTITTPPTVRKQAIGRVTEILGDHMAPGMEIDVAIRSHGLPYTWPAAIQEDLATLNDEVLEADKLDRVDLREKAFVTIDGEDAKDFDDAVYCEPKRKGEFTLYVAIADVSHYVQPGSALDEEAELRGNSVYFPGRVIPMLPEKLSNQLCSLRPHRDRLTMVCEMQINRTGQLVQQKFYLAVIHSKARLTYTNVAAMLVDQDAKRIKQYQTVYPHLENLYRLFKILRKAREVRGALDFEKVETKIIFGANRKIDKIVPQERNDAHKLIEECMLLANIAAATFLLKHKIAGLYRVHEGPGKEKLADLRDFLAELGLSLSGTKKPKPKDYAKLLATIREREDAHLIQTVLLRSLSQAVYSPDNIGHFGLAYAAYAQFTSPIRRYPDLLVHRAIRHVFAGAKSKDFYYDQAAMQKLGEHCSYTERRADEATYDVLDWLKCEYMLDHLGAEFAGIITGVTAFGLFIELKDIYVEGLMHVTALDNDYYHYDAAKHRLVGERTRKRYRLGDPIEVKVMRVDLDKREIDFGLVPSKRKKSKAKAKSKSKSD